MKDTLQITVNGGLLSIENPSPHLLQQLGDYVPVHIEAIGEISYNGNKWIDEEGNIVVLTLLTVVSKQL